MIEFTMQKLSENFLLFFLSSLLAEYMTDSQPFSTRVIPAVSSSESLGSGAIREHRVLDWQRSGGHAVEKKIIDQNED